MRKTFGAERSAMTTPVYRLCRICHRDRTTSTAGLCRACAKDVTARGVVSPAPDWRGMLRHVTGVASDSIEHYWPRHCEQCAAIQALLSTEHTP